MANIYRIYVLIGYQNTLKDMLLSIQLMITRVEENKKLRRLISLLNM